jgi:hypothetical protein
MGKIINSRITTAYTTEFKTSYIAEYVKAVKKTPKLTLSSFVKSRNKLENKKLPLRTVRGWAQSMNVEVYGRAKEVEKRLYLIAYFESCVMGEGTLKSFWMKNVKGFNYSYPTVSRWLQNHVLEVGSQDLVPMPLVYPNLNAEELNELLKQSDWAKCSDNVEVFDELGRGRGVRVVKSLVLDK